MNFSFSWVNLPLFSKAKTARWNIGFLGYLQTIYNATMMVGTVVDLISSYDFVQITGDRVRTHDPMDCLCFCGGTPDLLTATKE